MFLAENRPVIIVGDSIIKNLPPIDGVVIKSFRGDTIAQLTNRIDKGQVNLSPFDYIIIHVGTNNIDKRHSYGNIIADYGNLIPTIKKQKRSIRIIMSAILPRPCDHEDTDAILLLLYRRAPPFICRGTSLMTLSLWLFCCFIQINAGECSYLHVL